MKRIILLSLGLFLIPFLTDAQSLTSRLLGRILLQVEANGEAWYINPDNEVRYYMGRPADAFNLMRQFGVGIKHDELSEYLGLKFPTRLAGKIMLDVEENGEAYYIYPEDLKGYFLGRPADAFSVMRELGLGITDSDLTLINTEEKAGAKEDKEDEQDEKTSSDENYDYDFVNDEMQRLLADDVVLSSGHYEKIGKWIENLKGEISESAYDSLEEDYSKLKKNVSGTYSGDDEELNESKLSTVSDVKYEMDIIFFNSTIISAEDYARIEQRLSELEAEGEDVADLMERLPILEGHIIRTGSSQSESIVAGPDPSAENFTWTLPENASPLRLSLPADIDDFLFDHNGGTGGFGLHSGGHIEGVDHAWIELKPGTPVKSWADGVVTTVRWNGDAEHGEYHILINYGYNLIGWHGEIETPYVEEGELVKRGQLVGMGESFSPTQSSAEMGLIDRGRADGVLAYGGGVYVSPFDYLEESEKLDFIAAYKNKVIEPFVSNGTRAWGFEPSEPYLTNNIFLHENNEGKLSGVWYLTNHPWGHGYPNDYLVFIEAANPYYTGNVIRAYDSTNPFSGDWRLIGTFTVDYNTKQVMMIIPDYEINYYGIFEVDETGDDAVLKIEYQEGTYPTSFSSNVLMYTQRSNLSPGEDAIRLGIK